MKRVLQFSYGVTTYLMFFVTFVYLAFFLAGDVVPKTVDSDAGPLTVGALLLNVGLLGLFALQHTIMARPAFKRRFARVLPARVERNTFVLATCLVLGLLFWRWQAIEGVVWSVEAEGLRIALTALYWVGVAIVFVATLNIDHFHLFGLKQALQNLRAAPHDEPAFATPGLYRYVRHPIMVGFLIALWAVPTMTVGRLLFAGVATSYIFLAVHFLEERDLRRAFGERYEAYRREVGGYLPRFGRRRSEAVAGAESTSA